MKLLHIAHKWKSRSKDQKIKMTDDEILSITVVNSWKLVINRFDRAPEDFTDDQLGQQVAPDKNRVFYLLE